MVRAQYRWCPTVAIGAALANTWLGIVLAIVFFLATGVVEKTSAGEAILIGMDRLADPMAGVCRVYQWFGFLWTPLVRRLSAIFAIRDVQRRRLPVRSCRPCPNHGGHRGDPRRSHSGSILYSQTEKGP